jgi:hypothetical protein
VSTPPPPIVHVPYTEHQILQARDDTLPDKEI